MDLSEKTPFPNPNLKLLASWASKAPRFSPRLFICVFGFPDPGFPYKNDTGKLQRKEIHWRGLNRSMERAPGHFNCCRTKLSLPDFLGCSFFAHSWKLPAYSRAFLLTVDNFSFSAYSWSFFAYSFSFFTYSWSFFASSGKVRLISALRDCKQRRSTVSKKASTVSKKAPPEFLTQPVCRSSRLFALYEILGPLPGATAIHSTIS